ncbi:S1C family serine protease [Staphylococcus massiliensis]|uniref:Serine protease HtrA-like n=1 Tax=Staphylococcus massiliensis S46 TaxID=1229783 RepID=K9AVW0_9STAP|nr:trypsin-like peptidase domain-containing protein [Staphylococcus massiliensis]EKU50236.1 do-like Serine protease [Staphylococcus massiliensis S46]MCG3399738.1 trypsin-like peptidase domain-containing protein [Staphylococcus massiliensis]MCG3400842.1 trypsin-like peptidase domain-containing protein [Staphylococcus massiliensis]PNZ99983.1 PDZ domain-containing protein [Staphylococcus massiliensis CCUG 55927]
MYNRDNQRHYYRPRFPWFRVFLIALIAGIIGTMLVLGVSRLFQAATSSNEGGETVNETQNQKGGNVLDGKSEKYDSVNQMINDTSPAIVGVINQQRAQGLGDLLQGRTGHEEQSGIGSGVIYQKNDDNAFIVTNNHVIEGASSLKVQLHNSKQVDAKLVGKDALTDLAVLKIKNREDIKEMKFADSAKVKTGDSVFAMGNPLGLEFANTVTSGIISANERTIETDTSAGSNEVKVLQTDAAINPGNSGGALVDKDGNLIGINSMKISSPQVEGIGFAIPSNEVKLVIEQLVKHGEVERPSLGIGMINLDDIPPHYRDRLGIEDEEGVYVARISRPGLKLKEGDIIKEVDGKRVKNDATLRDIIYKKSPGDTVDIKVLRDHEEKTVTVELTGKAR